jgi:hypothetical protein
MVDDGLYGVYALSGSCRGGTLISGFYWCCKSRAEYLSDFVFIVACCGGIYFQRVFVLSLELKNMGAIILFVRLLKQWAM